jgi:hypothetical protein
MRECRHLTAMYVIGVSVALLAAGRSLAAPTPPAAAPEAHAAGGAGEAKDMPPSAKLAERAWWNQPDVVKAVQLKDEQRKKMDGLLAKTFDTQRATQVTQGESQKALEDALAKGDWESARKAAAKLRDGMTTVWGAQTSLKIDALAELDATQRQALVAQYPQILQQPSVMWVPKPAPRPTAPPAAPPPAAAKPGAPPPAAAKPAAPPPAKK